MVRLDSRAWLVRLDSRAWLVRLACCCFASMDVNKRNNAEKQEGEKGVGVDRCNGFI